MKRTPCAVAVAVSVLWAITSHAEPVRILLATGQGQGLPGEPALKYADRDAEHVRDVFTSVGGVRPEHAIVVLGATPSQIIGAIDRAQVMARTHRPDEVVFIFYFSGHGDREKLHLGSDTISMSDLSARIASVPASLRVVVTDACRTASMRPKGMAAEAPFSIALTGGGASGLAWLHASADGEAAQESDELGGAVFSHYWLSALRGAGDSDGDQRVTLNESYTFAYHQTLFRSARSLGIVQRPSADFDLHQAAPIILTQTSSESTALKLPAEPDSHYLVYAIGSRSVIAEAWSDPARGIALAVPSGRYIVQRHGAGGAGAAEVNLSRGEQRGLASGDFRPYPEEALTQKGGDFVLAPHELAVGYAVSESRLVSFSQHVGGYYGYRFGTWALTGGVEGGLGYEVRTANNVRVASVGASVRLEYRLQLGGTMLRAGLGVLGQYANQRLQRRDADFVGRAGIYATEQSRSGFGFGPTALVGLRVPIYGSVFIEPTLNGSLLFARFDEGIGPIAGFGGGLFSGLSF
jgi:hypothetical protein